VLSPKHCVAFGQLQTTLLLHFIIQVLAPSSKRMARTVESFVLPEEKTSMSSSSSTDSNALAEAPQYRQAEDPEMNKANATTFYNGSTVEFTNSERSVPSGHSQAVAEDDDDAALEEAVAMEEGLNAEFSDVMNADLSEASMPESEAHLMQKTKLQTENPRNRFAKRALTVCGWKVGVCGLSLAAVLTLSLLFFPKDPSWTIDSVEMDTTQFINIMTGNGNTTEPVPVSASVNIYNPNFVGAEAQEGHVQVFFEGELMAYGVTKPKYVAPRSNAKMEAEITVRFTDELAKSVMAAVLSSNFHLKVSTMATVPAQAGSIRAFAFVTCDLLIDAMKAISAPADVIDEKTCGYHIGF